MHIYTHTCTHIYIRMNEYAHVCTDRKSQQQRLNESSYIIDRHTHPYTYACIHTHIYIYTYVHNLIYTHVCLYTSSYLYISIYIYIYIYKYIYIYIFIYIYIHIYIYICRNGM